MRPSSFCLSVCFRSLFWQMAATQWLSSLAVFLLVAVVATARSNNSLDCRSLFPYATRTRPVDRIRFDPSMKTTVLFEDSSTISAIFVKGRHPIRCIEGSIEVDCALNRGLLIGGLDLVPWYKDILELFYFSYTDRPRRTLADWKNEDVNGCLVIGTVREGYSVNLTFVDFRGLFN